MLYEVITTATDACGNAVSASQVITVVDTTAPVLSGIPADETVECDAVPAAAIPTATRITSYNVCYTKLLRTSYSAQGTYTITWTYDDGNGNTSTQDQVVIVDDVIDPSIICGADIVVNVDPGECGAVIDYPALIGLDNCSEVNTVKLEGLDSGSLFPVGKSTITYQATDAAGNSNTCSFMVIVIDNIPPVTPVLSTVNTQCDYTPASYPTTIV